MLDINEQSKFIEDTIDKVYNNLTKFLLDTNYANDQSIHLRNELEKYKKNIAKNKALYFQKNSFSSNFLPNLVSNPNACYSNRFIYNQKNPISKNILRGFQNIKHVTERNFFSCDKKKLYKNKKNSKFKYSKYDIENKNQKFFHQKAYDDFNNTFIRNKDLSLGLYEMINIGLVPRGADVSPSLKIGGNPFNITSRDVKNAYKKCSTRDEIANGNLNKVKNFCVDDFYNLQPINKSKSKTFFNTNNLNYKNENIKTYNNGFYNKFFLTGTNMNSYPDVKNQKDVKYNTFNNIHLNNINLTTNETFNSTKYNKTNYTTNNTNIDITDNRAFYNYIKNTSMKNNHVLKYYYFELITDDEFQKFKEANQKNWKKINNILANFNVLFEKLNIISVAIDSNKILALIKFFKNKSKNITNKDLLMCLTEKDLKAKGYNVDNEQILYLKIKEAFIIRIQKMIRKKIKKIKYKKLKKLNDSVITIQKKFRKFSIQKSLNNLFEKEREQIKKKYNELLNKLQDTYDEIQEGPRVEIHINSLSYKAKYNQCFTDKYSLKESLQLNRLIKLIDPNIEIIYILPFEVSEEILSYYYSILENIGVSNIENRVHFLIPEACEFLPLNYSLSKLLLCSHRTINEIKRIIFGKKSYIIPGLVGGDCEEKISCLLNVPMLMPEKNEYDLIFNKSGIKNTFELNDIPFPVSAWNIITEEEFYSSLAHLIASYPELKIWIFKTNEDNNATGIAYLNTDKIDFINQLKTEKKNNPNFTVENFQEKLYYQLKNILNKHASFAYKNLYSNWKNYLQRFLANKGIIECCPTKELDGIMGKPCVPFLIEPNGKIKVLPTYEKINVENFKNIICTSPQQCIDNKELVKIAEKVGNYLFTKKIIGYVTIDCITFHNSKKILYWCIDMKFGLTQTICDMQYINFLYVQSFNNKMINNSNNDSNINENDNKINDNKINDNKINDNNINDNNINDNNINNNIIDIITDKNYNDILCDSMTFSIPFLTGEFIKKIKMKDLIREYRFNNVVYNIHKKQGLVFNFCDGLECGLFGLCGIISLENIERITPELKLWRLIEQSLTILKNSVYSNKQILSSMAKNIVPFDKRNDAVGIHLIYSKIKRILKEKEIEQQKKDEIRKKIANSPYL